MTWIRVHCGAWVGELRLVRACVSLLIAIASLPLSQLVSAFRVRVLCACWRRHDIEGRRPYVLLNVLENLLPLTSLRTCRRVWSAADSGHFAYVLCGSLASGAVAERCLCMLTAQSACSDEWSVCLSCNWRANALRCAGVVRVL